MADKCILLVEDEQLERERLTGWLSQDPYTIVQVNNGAEALALFKGGGFDLVITDFKLPFMNGSELAAHIKQLNPWQPVLMISPFWQPPGPDNPVDASLHRSCQPERLRQVVAELMARQPLREQIDGQADEADAPLPAALDLV